MALTEEERIYLIERLDKCDAELADKPNLRKIYGKIWRAKFREQILAVNSLVDAGFPDGYYAPCLDMPVDYQQRIEEGATIMLERLRGWACRDFFSRMQGRDSASAIEELLLVRGFFNKFGEIKLQKGNRSEPRSEFDVTIQGYTIAIEARGLRNSKIVQKLNDDSWHSGRHYWLSADPEIGKSIRVQRALAEKILESAEYLPRIIILSIYSAFDTLNGIDFARQMALSPEN